MNSPEAPLTGLILAGGGARGAYQVGALQAIAELLHEDRNPFPVITGASVGAINAAVLASHSRNFRNGVARLVKFWRKMKSSDVFRTDFRAVASRGFHWVAAITPLAGLGVSDPQSFLDSAPLETLLRKNIDLAGIEAAIKDGALRCIGVTASSYDRARAITFFQGCEGIGEWVRARRDGVAVSIDFEHLLASTALPFVFPARRIGNEHYGDGSLRLTAPLSPAIRAGAERILVIGARDLKPNPATTAAEVVYPSLGAISGYMLDMIFMDNLDVDIERARRINHTLSLLAHDCRSETSLREIDILKLQPSRDLRDIAAAHAMELPWTIRMLLKRLGVWGRDWRLPSYLLFEPGYCRALIELGYHDTLARRDEVVEFLSLKIPPNKRAS